MNCCYVSSRVFYLGSLCFFRLSEQNIYVKILAPNIYANQSTRLCSQPDASLPIVGHWVTLITSISSSFKHRWLSLSRWLGRGCEKKCCVIWTYSSVIFQKVQGKKRKKLLPTSYLKFARQSNCSRNKLPCPGCDRTSLLGHIKFAVELFAHISRHFSLIFSVAFLIYLHAFEQVLPHRFP